MIKKKTRHLDRTKEKNHKAQNFEKKKKNSRLHKIYSANVYNSSNGRQTCNRKYNTKMDVNQVSQRKRKRESVCVPMGSEMSCDAQ